MKWKFWVVVLLFLCSCAREPVVTLPPSIKNQESVVLVHGLGRSSFAMWLLASRLEDAGFQVVSVDYDSINTPMEEIIEDVSSQIDEYYRDHPGTIHFVGHSLGGLVIRAYLDEHRLTTLGKAVLIGTPNQGTPLADRFKDNWLLKLFSNTALTLGTAPNSFPQTLEAPYYPVGVIAGKTDSFLTGSLIAGDDDGLVPVSSTPVQNMSDFVLVDVSHSSMRYDKNVANQTIHFLTTGQFYKH